MTGGGEGDSVELEVFKICGLFAQSHLIRDYEMSAKVPILVKQTYVAVLSVVT